jgi:hypothetical protein
MRLLARPQADPRLEPRRRRRTRDVDTEVEPRPVEGILDGGDDRRLARSRRAVQHEDLSSPHLSSLDG